MSDDEEFLDKSADRLVVLAMTNDLSVVDWRLKWKYLSWSESQIEEKATSL